MVTNEPRIQTYDDGLVENEGGSWAGGRDQGVQFLLSSRRMPLQQFLLPPLAKTSPLVVPQTTAAG
jgi:hypothetical protein